MVRLCFHCGEPGHVFAKCPSRSGCASADPIGAAPSAQSAAGKEAFQRYLNARNDLTKNNTRCALANDRKKKSTRHYLQRVRQWMEDAEQSGNQCQSDEACRARDPIAVLQKMADATSTIERSTQRWNDLHRAKHNDLDKAQRESFNRIMDDVRDRLAVRLDVSPSDEAESMWHVELSRAVELGRPADFSSHGSSDSSTGRGEDDTDTSVSSSGRCLKVYAVEKLQARCRQLHHLLFCDDCFATRIRSKVLLPVSGKSYASTNTVNVLSLGGGPGYDHVAVSLVAKFLYDIQPHRSTMLKRVIQTQVYDLFANDWERTMVALGDCFQEGILAGQLEHDDENDEINCSNNKDMTMHPADLRLGLDENVDLACSVKSADIICAQFVLHENSSSLLETIEVDGIEEQRIKGVMKDVFDQAAIGTFVICTDSANTLFPALKKTAQDYGWAYLGDEEKRAKKDKLTNLGPKSYVIFERRTER